MATPPSPPSPSTTRRTTTRCTRRRSSAVATTVGDRRRARRARWSTTASSRMGKRRWRRRRRRRWRMTRKTTGVTLKATTNRPQPFSVAAPSSLPKLSLAEPTIAIGRYSPGVHQSHFAPLQPTVCRNIYEYVRRVTLPLSPPPNSELSSSSPPALAATGLSQHDPYSHLQQSFDFDTHGAVFDSASVSAIEGRSDRSHRSLRLLLVLMLVLCMFVTGSLAHAEASPTQGGNGKRSIHHLEPLQDIETGQQLPPPFLGHSSSAKLRNLRKHRAKVAESDGSSSEETLNKNPKPKSRSSDESSHERFRALRAAGDSDDVVEFDDVRGLENAPELSLTEISPTKKGHAAKKSNAGSKTKAKKASAHVSDTKKATGAVGAFSANNVAISSKNGSTYTAATGTKTANAAEAPGLNVYTGLCAAVLTITGFFLVFFGHGIFKPVLFVSGFYFFGILTFTVLQAVEFKLGSLFGSGDHHDMVYLLVCTFAGVLGGLLFMCFWRAGMFAVGALLGFVLASFILSLVSGGIIPSGIGRSIFLVTFVLLFGLAIFFVELPLLILGTAIPGSYAIVLGMDLFAGVGFARSTKAFLTGTGDFVTTWKVWLMIALFIALSIVGTLFQFLSGRKSGHHRGLAERDEMRKNEMQQQLYMRQYAGYY
ncbi:hypothetical protein DFJ73DRAFT_809686 [Zopfochytrium polystomum]|nr:hypothetical protein DFJ73DRAFT_809686 [Zopfochytrium polystomum]